jgi:hypothetical protein
MARFGCGVSGRTCAREHITPASFYTTGSCTIPQSPRLRMCAHTLTPGMSRPPLSHARIVQTGQTRAMRWTTRVRNPPTGDANCVRCMCALGAEGSLAGYVVAGRCSSEGRVFGAAARMHASENSAATCSATAPPCHNATPVRTETSGVKARSGAEGRGQGVRGKSYKQGQSVEQAGGSGPERILR